MQSNFSSLLILKFILVIAVTQLLINDYLIEFVELHVIGVNLLVFSTVFAVDNGIGL